MATSDHKAPARPVAAPGKPTSELGRPYWVHALAADSELRGARGRTVRELATCATLSKGTHALAHILCNSEAFRALQDACADTDPRQAPLAPGLTESLFAALYVLSEQTEQACMALLEDMLEVANE